MPTVIETQKFIFVHGGLPSNNLDKLKDYKLFELLKLDGFMDKGICFEKFIVVGHWPVSLYNDVILQSNPVINKKQKIISIDGGCGIKTTCQLNAFMIENIYSINFSHDYYDNFRIGYANTPQEASADSINIRWNDSEVEIVGKDDENSTIVHKTSGKILEVPNRYISGSGENTHCHEYTDYYLNVSVGDKLSIIDKSTKGYFVKKHGISGWFDGEIVFNETVK